MEGRRSLLGLLTRYRAISAIVVVAFGLRVVAASNDFWLDEIWTWMTTLQMESASDVLFRIRDENNHFLNTLWIYWLGPNAGVLSYRLGSVVTGTLSVAVAGLIGNRQSKTAGCVCSLLMATSYLQVHYSSEARGYGAVVCFSLIGFWLLERSTLQPSTRRDGAFAIVSVLGILAQPMFVYAYGSLGIWWLIHTWPQRQHLRHWIASGFRCHLLPIAFGGWLYAINVRHMVNGGGPIDPLADVLSQTLSLTVGGPYSGWPMTLQALLALLLVVLAIWKIAGTRDRRWVFFTLIIFVMPALLLIVVNRSEIYPRYFVISQAFATLALGLMLAEVWQRSGRWRGISACLLVLIVSGNLWHVERLARLGRGNYRATLAWMFEQSGSGPLFVGSDHDFRNQMLLSFHQQFFERRIVYFDGQHWPPNGQDWFIAHRIEEGTEFAQQISPNRQTEYRLKRVVPYAGLSGWEWAIYRRADLATEADSGTTETKR